MNNKVTDKQVTIVVGAQWGDEGKGKMADFLTKDADYVVRFQGGNNAGHTLKIGTEVYKLHLIPSGILHPDKVSVIGNGTLIDPSVLMQEIKKLEDKGMVINLRISQRAHIIMPYHRLMDGVLGSLQGQLAAGSTGSGIAPVCGDKSLRLGIRVIDLLEPEVLNEKLDKVWSYYSRIFEAFDVSHELTFGQMYSDLLRYGTLLSKYIEDTEVLLHEAYKTGKKIVFEGAQGMSLDPDQGVYPHGTSTNNVATYAGVGSGLGMNEKKHIIGVAKAYVSRVGQSPFPSEIEGEQAVWLRDKGGEYGTTTGRPRRVGWLDIVQLKQAARTSGITAWTVTKLDILTGLDSIPVCIGYKLKDGTIINEMPASLTQFREAVPVYHYLPGWREYSEAEFNTMIAEGYDALPDEIQEYIEFIESETDIPVQIVSLGPERNQTIVRSTM